MRWTPPLIVSFFFLCSPLGGASATFPVHKGCFETDFVELHSYYYKISHTLTWDDCVQVCNKRLTVYAGIQSEKGSPTYNHCYCGNDLQKHSPPTNNSLCKHCEDKVDKFCGGDATMSVYHLRGSTPLAVLLATSSGIQLLTDSSNATQVLFDSPGNPAHMAVDYLYDEDAVFFVSDKNIYRSNFNYLTLKYIKPVLITVLNNKIQDITIDWFFKRIYFSDYIPDIVYETYLNGTVVKSIMDRNYVKSLSLDPYSRVVYFNEEVNSLFSYDLKNKSYTENNKNRKFKVHRINCMTIDIHEQMFYIVGTLDEDQKLYLTSISLKDQNMRTVFDGPQLTEVKKLDVYKNEAVWVNSQDGVWQFYRCKLTPKCDANNLKKLGPPFNTEIKDITIYHPERQTPTNEALCKNMMCSHFCERESLFEARCACPKWKEISPDKKNCQDALSTMATTLVKEAPLVTDTFSTMATTLVKEAPLVTDTPLVTVAPSAELDESTQMETNHDDNVCPTFAWNYFKVIVVVAVFGVVFLQAILLYLRLRVPKPNRDVAYRCQPNEVEEGGNVYEDLSNIQVKLSFKK